MKINLKALCFLSAGLILAGLPAVLPAFPSPAQPQAQPAATTLTQHGDELYEQRTDIAKAKEALAFYQDALIQNEDAFGVYWRMARVEYWIGDHAESKDEKKQSFQMGIYHAKKAVALKPDRPEGHYWLGVNYGSYGEAKGVLASLSYVGPIKDEMKQVLAIDPSFEYGGADQLLGRLYYELPGLFGGDKKKSLDHLLKSKELGPRVGLTRIFLADTYLALGEVEKAREELQAVQDIEPYPTLIPETAQEKKMAADKLKGKEFQKK
jgi:tetratricopeptide (TPR) repeat protein